MKLTRNRLAARVHVSGIRMSPDSDDYARVRAANGALFGPASVERKRLDHSCEALAPLLRCRRLRSSQRRPGRRALLSAGVETWGSDMAESKKAKQKKSARKVRDLSVSRKKASDRVRGGAVATTPKKWID